MTQHCLLDTNICSFIMRERTTEVLAKLQACVDAQQRIVISAIT
jgi:tRNA(fMet)-specific endonuclease VapC